MVIGTPTDEQRRLFDHTVAAQDVAFEALGPGVSCADVDNAVLDYFREHELMPFWRQHVGHAIGLRNHEAPFLDTGDHTQRPGQPDDLGALEEAEQAVDAELGLAAPLPPRLHRGAAGARRSRVHYGADRP